MFFLAFIKAVVLHFGHEKFVQVGCALYDPLFAADHDRLCGGGGGEHSGPHVHV